MICYPLEYAAKKQKKINFITLRKLFFGGLDHFDFRQTNFKYE